MRGPLLRVLADGGQDWKSDPRGARVFLVLSCCFVVCAGGYLSVLWRSKVRIRSVGGSFVSFGFLLVLI